MHEIGQQNTKNSLAAGALLWVRLLLTYLLIYSLNENYSTIQPYDRLTLVVCHDGGNVE